ncbi:hypothetical protein [Agromyces larvae]|uniref:hypothetical protein n=1 Tax=Agromyces larvae TaxID=2929802 RepID=UPI0033900100
MAGGIECFAGCRERAGWRSQLAWGSSSRYAAANRAIIAALEAANVADPAAHHIFDDGPDLGWQFAAADVAIVDISAMVYDRLAAGKPLLITKPVAREAQIDTGGYLQACEWLEAGPDASPAASRRPRRRDARPRRRGRP